MLICGSTPPTRVHTMPPIPPAVIGTLSPILAQVYTHSELNSNFMAARFPGDPPEGNKVEKCRSWLQRANSDCADPLVALGSLIAEFMDVGPTEWHLEQNKGVDPRIKINAVFAQEGLSYQRGGYIMGAALSGPSKSLAERMKAQGVQAIEIEYNRAYRSIESDPPAAVTAACAILESVCKVYLEEEKQEMPAKQVLGNLWNEVATHLGLLPKDMPDDDLKRILQGLFGIAGGVAALRTHEGSAHGRSKNYKLSPRHARLAVHAAHTMAMFVLETWEERKSVNQVA
jgi:hypothetical protein